MSLHDKLAQQAISMGKGSSEFKAAAQKHANATWLLAIGGGVIWYFLGWAWAVILIALGVYTALKSVSATMVATRLENHEQASESGDTDSVRIIQAYGKILETSTPVPGTVADASKLPYPKQQIKDAIVAALRSTDDQQMEEYLKAGYIQLSDWQEGVGETNQGLDVSALDMDQDAESLAKAVFEQSSGSQKWPEMAQKEYKVLKQELQALGLW
jgi:flagellar basal body-associated protein FliL